MLYTSQDIKHALGSSYHEDYDYVLARVADIIPKERDGWVKVGTIPDFTTNETGIMTIMGRPKTKGGS